MGGRLAVMEPGLPWPRPVGDTTAAGWVAGGVGPIGSGVGALVPRGFEAYARILHPASSVAGDPVSWAEVAGWSGGVSAAEEEIRQRSIP